MVIKIKTLLPVPNVQPAFDFQDSFIFLQAFLIHQQDQAEVTMHQALLLIPWRCFITTYEVLTSQTYCQCPYGEEMEEK